MGQAVPDESLRLHNAEKVISQGLKPGDIFRSVAARLKSCPVAKLKLAGVLSQVSKTGRPGAPGIYGHNSMQIRLWKIWNEGVVDEGNGKGGTSGSELAALARDSELAS